MEIVTHAKIVACGTAVEMAVQMGTSRIILETDALEVVQMVKLEGINRSMYGIAIQDLKYNLQGLDEGQAVWVRRFANKVAHCLAIEALESKMFSTWVSEAPSFISLLLVEDCSTANVFE
uniref:RNase H type-1 domain-containing protein n=1 Tax=Leersia perrieri TaxID=77586 RepID=A0A0D9XF72_9ORYZ